MPEQRDPRKQPQPSSEKDRLADALSQLARGEHAPDDHLSDSAPSASMPLSPTRPAPAPPAGGSAMPRQPTPQPGRPVSASRPAQTARPAALPARPSPKPVAPAPPPKPAPPRAPRPQRPDAPQPIAQPPSPAAPDGAAAGTGISPARPQEPAAPSAPDDATTSALSNVFEDDDVMSIPSFDPRAAGASSAKVRSLQPAGTRAAAGVPFYASLGFRRTLIPILLTMGVSLPALAGWWFTLEEDAPLKTIGRTFPVTLISVGVVMLLLAILNMLQVRRQLLSQPQR